MFKYVFLISLLALAHAGLLSQPITYTKHEEDYDHHPQYKFNYNVHDLKTGDIKDQEESRNGDHVQGSYSLVEPDGSKRIVEYSADEHSGFNAIVRKEVGHHQEIQYQTISQHQPIQHATVLHQSIRPAAVSLHQPIQPAAAISIHEPVQPAAISLQQPIQQAAISIHEPFQQAAIGLHQPIQQAANSHHQPIQQATVSYQQPLIQPAIQHQEIGHQAQHGQLYTTRGLGYYGSGHLPLGSQAYPSYESGKLDLSGQQQLISQGLGQHDCSKFALTSHGSFGPEQSLISSELHNGHQETKYVQQAPIKTAQYPPLQIKQQLPVKIVGQYAPQSGYGHSEIKIQQHLSPTYEHGHQLSQGGQSYTDIKIDHIQTAKQISNAHTSLGQSQIKYEQIQQPQLIQPLQPIEHSYGPSDYKIQLQAQLIQPIQQSYSPPDIKIQHQHQLMQPIQQSYGLPDFKIQQQAQLIQPIQQSYSPPDIKIQQQSQLIQPIQQSYGPPDFKIQQQIGQSDLSRYEQKIQQSSQQLSESYSSASSISSSGEASQGYIYDKPAIKFELPTKAYGAP